MRTILVYRKAKRIRDGVSICNAGYEHCVMAGSNHYHCSQCGGITGMMAHWQGKDKPFSCQEPGVELKLVTYG